MFIELTSINDDQLYVNMKNVNVMAKDEGDTEIALDNGDLFKVKESYEQVKELIKLELQAERGY